MIDRPVDSELRTAFARYDAARQASELEAALEHARRVAELAPGLGTPEYNVACAYAMLGQTDPALQSLAQAIDYGYDSPEAILADQDLSALHELDRFQALVARAREQTDQATFIHVPDTITPSEPTPVFVVLHNFGGNARSIGRQWTTAADAFGAVLLAPKAPKAIAPAQARWTSPGKAESIVREQLAELANQYRLAPSRTVLIGIAQGAEIAYAVGLAHPDRFAGIVAVAGRLPETPPAQLGSAAQADLRVSILVGRGDREEHNSRIAAEALQRAGLKTMLEVYDAGHRFLPPDAVPLQHQALEFVLNRKPTATGQPRASSGGTQQ